MYACFLEACPLNIADVRSLGFVIDSFFIKLFKTDNINTVRFCQIQFGYQLLSIIIPSRTDSFLNKLVRLRSPYYMRPWHVNKTKDTTRPQGWRKHVTDVLM